MSGKVSGLGMTGVPPWERPWFHLETLPRSLWLQGVSCSTGTAPARLPHVQRWLEALSLGQLPDLKADFGDLEASLPLRHVVGELNLPAMARGLPVLAEHILRTMLWHLDRLADLQPEHSRSQAIEQLTAEFRAAWRVEKAGLEPELALLRELADGASAHLQWDQVRGRLRSREWQIARAAAARLGDLPEIVRLLERLGRREFSVDPLAGRRPDAPAASGRVPLVPVVTRLAGAPGEITGIRFGSRIEHMLPCEAVWLRHPLLRRLWRARQAEGRLLTHDTEAVVMDWRADPLGRVHDAGPQGPEQRLSRGPIVLCLDTSGSMRGAPENIAKAVALAALRAAQQAGRGLKLVAFGGPGELVERELRPVTASVDGHDSLAPLLELMGQSFDGGTDVQTPIERAIEIVHEQGWTGADLLIVSDGEFGCVRATLDRLDLARQRLGLRVQGVLVGDRETMGMLEVCDAIHWVRHWRSHGHVDAATAGERRNASPVHSKSLTALYFPNALSGYAARHREDTGSAGVPHETTPPRRGM